MDFYIYTIIAALSVVSVITVFAIARLVGENIKLIESRDEWRAAYFEEKQALAEADKQIERINEILEIGTETMNEASNFIDTLNDENASLKAKLDKKSAKKEKKDSKAKGKGRG
jgi:tRNA G10  N-methylase Trm11